MRKLITDARKKTFNTCFILKTEIALYHKSKLDLLFNYWSKAVRNQINI